MLNFGSSSDGGLLLLRRVLRRLRILRLLLRILRGLLTERILSRRLADRLPQARSCLHAGLAYSEGVL